MPIFTTKVVEATDKNPDGINRQQIIKMCAAGEKIKLIREPNNPHDVCAIGVFREAGELIGYLGKHVSNYPELAYHMDIGGEVSAKVEKIIAERSGFLDLNKTYYCIVEITKGPVLIFKKEIEAKEIIEKAKSIEENDPELAINLYQKAMAILGEVDRLCEKNTEMDELIKIYGLKKWRYVEYPINRLTFLLEKLMRFQECLEQIEKYEQIDDRVGLNKKDKESLDKRKAQIIRIGETGTIEDMGAKCVNYIFLSRLKLLIIMAKAYLKNYPVGKYRKTSIIENAHHVFHHSRRLTSSETQSGITSEVKADEEQEFHKRVQLLAVMAKAIAEDRLTENFNKKALQDNLNRLCEILLFSVHDKDMKFLKVA